jgi:hypothetical protein
MGHTVDLAPGRSFYDILFEAGIRGGFVAEGIDDGVGLML